MQMIVIILILTMGICQTAAAQSVAGTYTLPTSAGAVTLSLTQDGPDGVRGTLVDDDGTIYQIQGSREGDAFSGSLASAAGTVAAIEGVLEAEGMRLLLVPFDAAGEPSYASVQEYVLTRQGDSTKNPGSTVGGPLQAPGADLAGSYSGSINGTPAALTIQQSGTTMTGRIDAAGYGYTLEGTVSGSGARGTLGDPQTGASMEFELASRGDALDVTLLAADPSTSQVQRIPLSFERGEAARAGGSSGSAGGAGGPVPAQQALERDPAMVGSWSYSDTYISGEFSATTRLFMQLNPDGTYAYGDGQVTAGLDNSLGSVWGDTGNSGNVSRGQWRTEGGIVYIMEGGSTQWEPYARYYVERGSMMFTFGDGSKKLWSRR